MKEALIHRGPKVEIIDSPVPEPGPDQVVTKVIVSGSNPKDWKASPFSSNQTFDPLTFSNLSSQHGQVPLPQLSTKVTTSQASSTLSAPMSTSSGPATA